MYRAGNGADDLGDTEDVSAARVWALVAVGPELRQLEWQRCWNAWASLAVSMIQCPFRVSLLSDILSLGHGKPVPPSEKTQTELSSWHLAPFGFS